MKQSSTLFGYMYIFQLKIQNYLNVIYLVIYLDYNKQVIYLDYNKHYDIFVFFKILIVFWMDSNKYIYINNCHFLMF